jgi:hypothetical protein
MFRRKISPPISEWKGKPSKKPEESADYFIIVPWLAYSSILKIEAVCSTENPVAFHRTWCYTSEDITLP